MKVLRKSIVYILIIASVFAMPACSRQSQTLPAQSAQPKPTQSQPVPAETPQPQIKPEGLAAELSALNGVVNVERFEKSPDNTDDPFSERYVVEFEQPVSWDNPDTGTFRQRVFIGYKGKSSINVFHCGGYLLDDNGNPDFFKKLNGEELSKHYDANYFEIEYRFFGKSVPEGLSTDSELYWKYFNSEEASKDFHHIITSLKSVFDGSTIFTGASKGGYTTEMMSMYFPDDIDAYVSYVAPFCDSVNDSRFYKNIYCTIGDLTYGSEEAKQHRNTILEFQKLLLSEEYRSVIQNDYLSRFDGKNAVLSPLITGDEAYETAVLEIACTVWQYKQGFDKYETVLAMPDGDDAQRAEKIEAAKELFFADDPVNLINLNDSVNPYYIQAQTEMGIYLIDLSYLREAGANVKTSPENDVSLEVRVYAPIMLNSSLKYSSSYKDKLLQFFKTTQKDIVKIYGKSDTWYAVRMPETGNEHIHIFEVDNSHISEISMLPENEQKECYDIIDGLLNFKAISQNEESQEIPEAA